MNCFGRTTQTLLKNVIYSSLTFAALQILIHLSTTAFHNVCGMILTNGASTFSKMTLRWKAIGRVIISWTTLYTILYQSVTWRSANDYRQRNLHERQSAKWHLKVDTKQNNTLHNDTYQNDHQQKDAKQNDTQQRDVKQTTLSKKIIRMIKYSANWLLWNLKWYSVEWHPVEWHSVEWHSVEWHSVEWHSVDWHSLVWHSLELYSLEWHSVEWDSLEWHPVKWNSLEWHRVHWHVVKWHWVV